MKNGAIVLDEWKLIIFKKHLDKAGFTYTQGPLITWGPLTGTLTLKVDYKMLADLSPVVEAANNEAAIQKNRTFN